MEVNLKPLIFLFLFILIGVVLLSPIVSYVHTVTTATITVGNTTQTNPEYVGASNVALVNLVPLFYILVLIIVPAVVAYKMYRD
jgi:hypothetical protein